MIVRKIRRYVITGWLESSLTPHTLSYAALMGRRCLTVRIGWISDEGDMRKALHLPKSTKHISANDLTARSASKKTLEKKKFSRINRGYLTLFAEQLHRSNGLCLFPMPARKPHLKDQIMSDYHLFWALNNELYKKKHKVILEARSSASSMSNQSYGRNEMGTRLILGPRRWITIALYGTMKF